jgi:head-tail adaptor
MTKSGLPKGFSAGDMRHRIDIQKRLPNGNWESLFVGVPASQSPSTNSQYRNMFTFWERGHITNQNRVVKNGETFGIGVVIAFDALNRVTQLFCSEGSGEYTELVQMFTETLGTRNQHGHQTSTWTAGETFKGKIFLDGTAEESDRPSETSAETVRILLRYPVVLVGQQAEWNGTRYRVSETQYRVWDTLVTLRPVKEAA